MHPRKSHAKELKHSAVDALYEQRSDRRSYRIQNSGIFHEREYKLDGPIYKSKHSHPNRAIRMVFLRLRGVLDGHK